MYARLRNNHRKRATRKGMAVVELALVLPVVIMLCLGIIESGNMFYSWLTLQKAAQEGARFAVTGQGDEEGTRLSQIISTTEQRLSGLAHGTKKVTVSSWPTFNTSSPGVEGDPGQPCHVVEIKVVYNYTPIVPLISALLPPTVPLSGSDRKINEPWRPCDDNTGQ